MPVLLALKLFAGSAIKKLFGWLGSLNGWQIVCLGLALFAAIQTLRLSGEKRHSAKVETQLAKCTSARHADQLAYTKAQSDAQAKNLATVVADKAQRERITNDISQSYEAQLASLRADLARRLRVNTAAQSAPGQSGLPGVSPAPSGADAESRVSIPSSLYVRGGELELQLEQLQKWVGEQSKIDPNK